MIRDMSHFTEKEDVGKVSAAFDPRARQMLCGLAHDRGGCPHQPQGRASEPPPQTNMC